MKNIQQRMLTGRIKTMAVLACLMGLTGLSTAEAAWQQPQLNYQHALAALNAAHVYMAGVNDKTDKGTAAAEKSALHSLEQALFLIKHGIASDAKANNDQIKMDANLKDGERYQKAVQLLKSALSDLSKDDPAPPKWRKRVVIEINQSLRSAGRVVQDENADSHDPIDGTHPNYLKALSDLRSARTFLVGQDEKNVVEDARVTMKAIDEAIEAAKNAAIADGFDTSDKTPVDTNSVRRDRYENALRLIQDAHIHLTKVPESNVKAQDNLRKAIAQVDIALAAAKKTVADDRQADRAKGKP